MIEIRMEKLDYDKAKRCYTASASDIKVEPDRHYPVVCVTEEDGDVTLFRWDKNEYLSGELVAMVYKDYQGTRLKVFND